MFLCRSDSRRELATVIRLGFEMFGILLSLVLQTLIVGNPSKGCDNLPKDNSTGLTTELTTIPYTTTDFTEQALEVYVNAKKNENEDSLFNKYRYLIVAIIFSLIFTVCQLLLVFGVDEDKGMHFENRKYSSFNFNNLRHA